MTGKPAGQSAAEVARRHRDKLSRLERSAAAWEAGAAGEQATGEVLVRLDPAAWTVWHDAPWPGRQRANLDHVVVGPSGIFVVDSKNWSGTVTIADGVLRQNGRSREKSVTGALEAAAAVRQLVTGVPVQPVLCFAQQESLAGRAREVLLCSTSNLDAMLMSRPGVLTPTQVRAVVARLEAGFNAATPAVRTSTKNAARPRGRRSGSWRPWAGLLIVLAMLGSLYSGVFTTAIGWAGDRVSDVVIRDLMTDPGAERNEPPRPQKTARRGAVQRDAAG